MGNLHRRQLLQLHIPNQSIESEQNLFALIVFKDEDVSEALDYTGVFEKIGVIVFCEETTAYSGPTAPPYSGKY